MSNIRWLHPAARNLAERAYQAPGPFNSQMDQHRQPYTALDAAIPRGGAERVGRILGFDEEDAGHIVRRWCREPETRATPNGTGRRSPLDRMCQLLDAVFLVNPDGPGVLLQFLNEYVAELRRTHSLDWNPTESVGDILDAATDAVKHLLDGEITRDDEDALRQLVIVANDALERARDARRSTTRKSEVPRIRFEGAQPTSSVAPMRKRR